MKKASGYRLHIEATETAIKFRTMAEVRAEQKKLAKQYQKTFDQIDAISYIVTEEEYQSMVAQQELV